MLWDRVSRTLSRPHEHKSFASCHDGPHGVALLTIEQCGCWLRNNSAGFQVIEFLPVPRFLSPHLRILEAPPDHSVRSFDQRTGSVGQRGTPKLGWGADTRCAGAHGFLQQDFQLIRAQCADPFQQAGKIVGSRGEVGELPGLGWILAGGGALCRPCAQAADGGRNPDPCDRLIAGKAGRLNPIIQVPVDPLMGLLFGLIRKIGFFLHIGVSICNRLQPSL